LLVFIDELRWTKTRDIIPADLNAFLYTNAKILGEFCRKVSFFCLTLFAWGLGFASVIIRIILILQTGQPNKAAEYENIANKWREALNELLWDDQLGCWFDYDLIHKRLNTKFYPSNIVPLWAQAQESPAMVSKVVQYLKESTSLNYRGGIPSSLVHAGEQWDFPNGWAPLQHLVVEALHNSGDEEAMSLAFDIAERWIDNNYKAFKQTTPSHMFEKVGFVLYIFCNYVCLSVDL